MKKALTISLVISPILSAYSLIGSFDLGSGVILLSFLMAFIFDKNKFSLILPKKYLLFFVYIILTSVFINWTIPLRITLFTLLLLAGSNYFKPLYALRIYDYSVYVCASVFVVQEFMWHQTGIRPSGIFSFLPTIYGDISKSYINFLKVSERSSSLFLEPSYFVQYLAPFIAIKLFNKDTKNYVSALLITAIIIMARSGNGILLLLIIWTSWFIYIKISAWKKASIIIVFLLAAFLVIRLESSFLEYFLSRKDELLASGIDNKFQSSGFIRIYRSFYLFQDLPLINKVFGTNPDIVQNILNTNYLFDGKDSFLNGAGVLLVMYGIIGFILFFYFLITLGKNSTITEKTLIVCMILLMFTESYFISSRMLFTIILVYKLKGRQSYSTLSVNDNLLVIKQCS